jgi:hypothetical protein
MNVFFTIGFPILGFLLICGIVLNYSLLFRLKRKYHTVWENLGEPDLISNNSIKTNVAVNQFIKDRKDIPLNDKPLTLLVRVLKYYKYIYLIYFILFTIILLVLSYR